MNKKKSTAAQQFYSSILILLYLGIGFVPNLGAVDQIAPQWLYLNSLNVLTLAYLFFNRTTYQASIKILLNTKFFGLYVLFVLWSATSYFYAINATEVLVNLARVGGVFIAFFNMFILLKPMPDKFKILSMLMSIYLLFEMYMVLEPALEMIRTHTFSSRSRSLIGTTGNINIAALSMVMKIPFALYLINTSAKQWLKWSLRILIGLVMLSLVFIASRASYVAITLMMILYGMIVFIRYKKESKMIIIKSLVSFYLPIVLGIMTSQVLLAGQKSAITFAQRADKIVDLEDGSTAQRLRFYKVGLNHMVSNPIISGVGLGNWKLISIDYDKEDIRGYVVPYHMHNDIIQIGAELGVVGFVSYVGLFALVLFFMIKIWKSTLDVDTKFFVAFLFLSLTVYGIDANLNFPLARPIMQVMWVLVLALTLKLYLKTQSEDVTFKINIPSKVILFVLLLSAVPLSSIAYKTNLSLKGQQVLLGEYNKGELNYPLNQIDEVVPNIPNISVTTLPIVAMKGRYYSKAGKHKKAIEMFQEGIKVNPFLGFSENLIAQEYKKLNQLDSALKYSRIAYNKLPIPPHFTNYLIQAIRVKDTLEINRMFLKDSADYNKDVWKNYLVAMSTFNSIGNSKYIHVAKRGTELFPDQNDFKILHKTLTYGKSRVDQALAISQTANKLFSEGNYFGAVEEFKRSSELDPLEFSYYENIGASYFSAKAYEEGLPYFKKVIEELNPKSGKSEYLMAISLINLNRKEEACGFLEQSKFYGYKNAANAQKSLCKQNQ